MPLSAKYYLVKFLEPLHFHGGMQAVATNGRVSSAEAANSPCAVLYLKGGNDTDSS